MEHTIFLFLGLQDSFGKDDSDASNSSSVCETLKDLEAVIRKLGEDTGTSGGTPHDTVIQAALDQSSKIQVDNPFFPLVKATSFLDFWFHKV